MFSSFLELAMDFFSNTTNLNETEEFEDEFEMNIFLPINALINVMIYVVNITVIYLFYVKKRRLLTSPANQLLFSYFIIDVLGGTSITLQIALQTFPNFFLEKPRVLIGYRVFADLYTSFLISSMVMHLCGITLDRYLSLFYALHYQQIMTLKSTKRYIAISWILPLIVSLIQLSWLHQVLNIDNEFDVSDINTSYSFATFLLFLVFPMIFLAAMYIRMFLEIKRLLNSPPDLRTKNRQHVLAKQRRVIYIYSVMYIFFLILTMPYYFLRSYIDLMNGWEDQEVIESYLLGADITYLLKNLTSITSPLLYTGINRDTRVQLIELCCNNYKRLRNRVFDVFCYFSQKSSENIELSSSTSNGDWMNTRDVCIELKELNESSGPDELSLSLHPC